VPNPPRSISARIRAYVVCTNKLDGCSKLAREAGVFVAQVGMTGAPACAARGFFVELAELREASESFFRDWMES